MEISFDLELERHGGSIVLTSTLNKKDTIENLKVKNCFIKDTLLIWAEVNFDHHLKSEKQFLEQILWHNSLVRIDNCLIFSLNVCPLRYYHLLSALKSLWNSIHVKTTAITFVIMNVLW